jgi:uncharacterized protein
MTPQPGPVSGQERIQALDILRGFALLGILLMNVQSFSMISAAYFNPTAAGYFGGVDQAIWVVVHVLADSKFMTLFSILFGAGIVLMSERAKRAEGSPAAVHFRRNFWLIVIGAGHAYLLWYGDVLVWYGLCALLVFWMRKLPPRRLFIMGLLAVTVGGLLTVAGGLSLPQMPPETREEFVHDWAPDAQIVEAEVAAYTGGWSGQLAHRVPMALTMHTVVFLIFALWRAGGLMLVGMALFKWGVLSAERSDSFYRRLVALGVVGAVVVSYGAYTNIADGWTLEYARFYGSQYNYFGSLAVSAGYIGAIMIWSRGDAWRWLKGALAAVGRMAFTNYIMQTVLCTWIFYGHGLGRFMQADRTEQMLVVFGVWVFQLVVSPWWLRRFRFGPLEWIWRSLTYMKRQPFRIAPV